MILLILAPLLAVLATAVVGSGIFDFHKSDAAGQGLTRAYTFFFSVFQWILLGVLAWTCGARAGFSGWAGVMVLLLYVAAVAAHFAALRILSGLESGDRFESLLRWVVVASPSLIILYSLWNFFLASQAWISATAVHVFVGSSLAILSILPWAVMRPSLAATSARSEARQKAYEERCQREQKIAGEIQALPEETPLTAFFPYIDVPPENDSSSRYRAVQRMCKLNQRQTEIEQLLDQQDLRALVVLRDLDVQMTPALCAAGRKCALKAAEQIKPASAATTFDSMEPVISDYWQSMRWMLQNGCDCKREIAEFEKAVRLYPESSPRTWFLNHVLETLGKPCEY